MSDHDSKGKFAKGNQMAKKRALPRGLRTMLKKNRVEIFQAITKVANMTLAETKEVTGRPAGLSNIEAMAFKFWAELRENPNTGLYSMLFAIHGFDLNSLKEIIDEKDDEEEEGQELLPMTKEDKLVLLESLKKKVQSE